MLLAAAAAGCWLLLLLLLLLRCSPDSVVSTTDQAGFLQSSSARLLLAGCWLPDGPDQSALHTCLRLIVRRGQLYIQNARIYESRNVKVDE